LFLLALALALLVTGCGGSDKGYSLSSSSVSFTGTQGGVPPAAQTVSVSLGEDTNSTVYIATAQSGDCFSHSFATTGKTTGVVTIYPKSCPTTGVHGGTITVTGCSTQICNSGVAGSTSRTISVAYNVLPAPKMTSRPAAIEFTARSGVQPPSQTLNLALESGSDDWTSRIEYTSPATGWLSVSPAAGAGLPVDVTATANTTSLTNGQHTATIVFTSGGSIAAVPVTLKLFDPAVNFVSPYVGTSSLEGDVIIRGHGFTSVSAGMEVLFGTTAATSATVVNDTEIRATHPALVAGSYPVTVRSSAATLPSRARLEVLDRPGFAYSVIPYSGYVTDLIYDAERQSLYVFDDVDKHQIGALRFDGTTWVTGTPYSFGSSATYGWALAPDGTELLVSMGGITRRIDPSTLQVMDSVAAAALDPTFTNDGFAFVRSDATVDARLARYDMLTRQTSQLTAGIDISGQRFRSRSRDGSTVLFVHSSGYVNPPSLPIIVYRAADGSFTASAVSTSRVFDVSMDRKASRILIAQPDNSTVTATVCDGSLTAALGALPATAEGDALFVVSPDGQYAYAFHKSGNLIRKFNLAAPVAGSFVEIGSGTVLADRPSVENRRGPTRMTISPDGATLFIAGNQNIIVMPAP
jgi:hypothetical protein